MAEEGDVHQVYVGGISWSATEADLRELFSEVGEVLSAKIINDPFSDKHKGYGFVTFKEARSIEEAMQFSGREWMQRKIRVNHATFSNGDRLARRDRETDRGEQRQHPYRRLGGRGRPPHAEGEYNNYQQEYDAYPGARAPRDADSGYSRGPKQYPPRNREGGPPGAGGPLRGRREPPYREQYAEEEGADSYHGEYRRDAYREEYHVPPGPVREGYAESAEGYSARGYREAPPPQAREEYYDDYDYGPGYDAYPPGRQAGRYPPQGRYREEEYGDGGYSQAPAGPSGGGYGP
eukprot:CAMPEP_0118928826 /NCGR_PEP_ID=MMETSP1169-20130426/5986_1 /TAXON_ID=36882 /ORGANISM="Pyramimonas obovata, Strain CCMP722" /LENGTH=291 /DNA_ID=CAMNT_0006870891 /DNA_START=165 /DNA_END=1036 /DNA_ORIENTATION=-